MSAARREAQDLILLHILEVAQCVRAHVTYHGIAKDALQIPISSEMSYFLMNHPPDRLLWPQQQSLLLLQLFISECDASRDIPSEGGEGEVPILPPGVLTSLVKGNSVYEDTMRFAEEEVRTTQVC